MRFAFVIPVLWLASVPSAAARGESFQFFQPLNPPRDFQVMVPGGLAQQAPANTRAAIAMAIEDLLEWVELPVRRSADGQHILIGAEPLENVSDGKGSVSSQTLAELQRLDYGSWFARRFTGAKLLSLTEGLALAAGKINLCLDCQDVDPQRLAEEIVAAGAQRRVLLAGSVEVLKQARLASQDSLAIMIAWTPQDGPAAIDSLSPAVVDVESQHVSKSLCRGLHERGIKLRARTSGSADCAQSWDGMIAAGADFVRTALPEEVVAHVLAGRLRPRPVRFACHRGASRYAPENTLLAFAKAYRLGADFVEFDVRPSSDGEYFLMHDAKLDRTTGGTGAIRQASSATVEALDAGGWFARWAAGTRVPTLEQFLGSVPPGVELYFDAKDITPEALAAALAKHNLVGRTVVYQSAAYLERLKQVDSHIRGMPPSGSKADASALAAGLRPYAVDTRWTVLSKEYIELCHAAGIQVFSDAPFSAGVGAYKQAIEWGIDLIQTDYPLRVWRAMELVAAERAQR